MAFNFKIDLDKLENELRSFSTPQERAKAGGDLLWATKDLPERLEVDQTFLIGSDSQFRSQGLDLVQRLREIDY